MGLPPLPEPLAVWDTRTPQSSLYWRNRTECNEWYDEHIATPKIRKTTFRIEFYLVDAPFCVVYRYYEENGRRFKHMITGEIAAEEPELMSLDELPPAHLLS